MLKIIMSISFFYILDTQETISLLPSFFGFGYLRNFPVLETRAQGAMFVLDVKVKNKEFKKPPRQLKECTLTVIHCQNYHETESGTKR